MWRKQGIAAKWQEIPWISANCANSIIIRKMKSMAKGIYEVFYRSESRRSQTTSNLRIQSIRYLNRKLSTAKDKGWKIWIKFWGDKTLEKFGVDDLIIDSPI